MEPDVCYGGVFWQGQDVLAGGGVEVCGGAGGGALSCSAFVGAVEFYYLSGFVREAVRCLGRWIWV